MARPSNVDVLDKFRWSVNIEGFQRLGFASCGVPSITYNTNAYPEGGAHLHPRQIIDSVEYSPVTLMRGVTYDQSFYDWVRQAIELHRGSASSTSATTRETTQVDTFDIERDTPLEYRRDVEINHLDRSGRIVKTYLLINAIPVEFTPASEFVSDADDVLSMEKLVLKYEGFEVISNKLDTNPTDIRDIAKRLIRSF
jgi:phage tail-like protein